MLSRAITPGPVPIAKPEFDLTDARQCRIHDVFSKALLEKKSSINAKIWAYRGMTTALNVFDFTVSRHRDGPELLFEDFKGTLLGDSWHGFESISASSNGRIARAACNAHARRKFEKLTAYPAERQQWLLWYQQLYDIEDRAADQSLDSRLELRQAESVPIWQAMTSWMHAADQRTTNVILPKSDLAKALNYV
jgi:transposase